MKPREYKRIDFSSLDSALDDLVRHIPRSELFRAPTRIATMGSCFAGNVSNALLKLGHEAVHLSLSETQNTPLVNWAFIDYFVKGRDSEFLGEVARLVGTDKESLLSRREAIVESVKSCKVFILTIGVGFVWVNERGNISLTVDARKFSSYRSVFPSVDQHASWIESILDGLVKLNDAMKIFVTLSPVPLNFAKFDYSPMIADCISKSVLRSAVEIVLKNHPELVYFPSFEFFRWVSGHFSRPFYGADGKMRHVDEDLVDMVVGKFVEINGGA